MLPGRPSRYGPAQAACSFQVSPTRLAFDSYDVATQAMSSNYIEITDGHGEYTSFASATCSRPNST